jgi:ATP/maltotriose-dependent transcriptional regulator MalT
LRHDAGVGEFLEREAALASLLDYADEAGRGDSRIALVAGEAGIGKTRLVEALRDRLPEARWLWGACDGAFTPEPLGPLFDVAGQVGGALLAACSGDVPRDRMFRVLLAELADASSLTVLVVEDLHWADEATLDLVRFLARRLKQAKALVVLTFRDDGLGADHPLRATIGELATERSIRRIGLAPLSPVAVRRLAAGSGLAADALFELTGGNPFLVSEVIDAGSGEVPPSAREAVLARAARLTPAARRVLEAAAVIGSRVDVDLLREVAGTESTAVDDCLTSGALVSEAGSFRFRHELARRALEESIPAHRAFELHRIVLQALASTDDPDPAHLAHHADAVGDAETVLRYAPPAAERASALGAHTEALSLFQRAARYAGHADVRTRAHLFSRAADEAKFIDRWEESLEARQTALALWTEARDELRVGDTWALLSTAYWRLCRVDDCDAATRMAVEILEPLGPSAELASAYSLLCGLLAEDGDVDRAVDLAGDAAAMAQEFGVPAVAARALIDRACCRAFRGDDAFEDFQRAREAALASGDETVAGAAFANMHEYAARARRFELAQRCFDEGLAYVQDHEIDTYQSCLYAWHAFLLEAQGRYDEALTLLLDVLGRRHVSPANRLFSLPILARVHARRGDAAAQAALDEALDLAARGGDRSMVLEVALTQCELAWLDGRPADAAAAIAQAVALLRYTEPWTQAWVASWASRLGVSGGEAVPRPGPYALAAAGDHRAAAKQWLRLGCPYDAALALLDAGDVESLLEAARLLDDVGAVAALAVVQGRLRELGARGVPRGRRTATRNDEFGLTLREREVLQLLCAGMTNAEIAAELVIAQKTVDHHVGSVLTKMGVGSRRAAARKAVTARAVASAR